jgi:phage-related baseplate assembly protein
MSQQFLVPGTPHADDEEPAITRSDLTIVKLPGLPMRGRIETYSGDALMRAEWGPFAKLVPSLKRRHSLRASDVIRALLAQGAPEEVVEEAEQAMEA